MKKLLFIWHWLTNPSFRHYVYMHDMEAFQAEIQRMMRDKAEYEHRQMFNV